MSTSTDDRTHPSRRRWAVPVAVAAILAAATPAATFETTGELWAFFAAHRRR